MEVFILDAGEGFETEVIDDQQIAVDELGNLPLEAVGCPGGMELGNHPGCTGKRHVMCFPDGTVTNALCNVNSYCAAGDDDQDRDHFFKKSAGGQLRGGHQKYSLWAATG